MSRWTGPMVIVCACALVAAPGCRGKGEAQEPERADGDTAAGGRIENRVPEPEPEPEPEPDTQPEVVAPDAQPDPHAGAATQPTQGPLAAQVNLGQLMIGVAECDQFLRELVGCAATLPESTQRAMMQSVMQVKDAWQQASTTAEGRKELAQACQQALVSARQSYQQMGCFVTP